MNIAKRTAAMVAIMLAGSLGTAQADWLPTAGGTYDYLDANNWAGGVVDGNFPASLTLTGSQVATFDAGHTTGPLLNFGYDGDFGVTLRADGVADQTLTLDGNVNVDTAGGSNANVTIGSTTANEKLNVDLGGAPRTFDVAAARTLTVQNVVSNGGLIKAGDGTLSLKGVNTYAGGTTFAGGQVNYTSDDNLGAAGADLTFDGGAMVYDNGASYATSRDITVNAGGGTIMTDRVNTTITFNGQLSGTGKLDLSLVGFGNPVYVFTQDNSGFSGGMESFDSRVTIELRDPNAAGTGSIANEAFNNLKLNLRDDADTTYNFAGIEKSHGPLQIDVDQETGAGAGRTLTIPVINVNSIVGNNTNASITATGGHDYQLAITQLNLNDNSGHDFFVIADANTIVGALDMDRADHLVLDGAATGSRITGAITSEVNNANANVGRIDKQGAGTWELAGDSTYNGKTTITEGTLLVTGSITPNANLGGVFVDGGTLGGGGDVNTFVVIATGATIAPGRASATWPSGIPPSTATSTSKSAPATAIPSSSTVTWPCPTSPASSTSPARSTT